MSDSVIYLIVHPIPLPARQSLLNPSNRLSRPKQLYFRGSTSLDEVGHWTTMNTEALAFDTEGEARKVADSLFPVSRDAKIRRFRIKKTPEQTVLPIRESEK